MKVIYPSYYYFPVFAASDDYENLLRSNYEEDKAGCGYPSKKYEGYIDVFSEIDNEYVRNTI